MSLPHFNGSDYIPELDHGRLSSQYQRVFDLMSDSKWRTLEQIAQETGEPVASISAQLRHMRKPRFGSNTVNKKRVGEPRNGLYEYQVIPAQTNKTQSASSSPV